MNYFQVNIHFSVMSFQLKGETLIVIRSNKISHTRSNYRINAVIANGAFVECGNLTPYCKVISDPQQIQHQVRGQLSIIFGPGYLYVLR